MATDPKLLARALRERVIQRGREGMHEGPDYHVPLKARKIAKMDNNTGSRGYYQMKDYRNTMNLKF